MINTGGIQLRLGDFVYGIVKRWKLILVLTFMGLIFGVMLSAVSYMQGSYSNYLIQSSFAVLTTNAEDEFAAYGTEYQSPSDFNYAALMVDTVNYVIKSDRNMNQAIEAMKIIGVKPKDLSQNLTLTQIEDTSVVEAAFTWRDAEEGVKILTSVLESAQESLQDTLRVGEISVIDAPAAKQTLSNTIGGSVWGYMTILGFLAGVGFVALELLMRPTLTNLKDVETVLGLETLGTIPKEDKYFKKKKSLLVEDDVTAPRVTQNYASTAYILRNRLSKNPTPHCIYVTSTRTGEGKTSVAANLAIQLSDMEQRVLLIDMDTRNPTLGKLFMSRVEYDRSLNALYRGDSTREDSIFMLTGYLDLLPTVIDRQPIPMDGTIFDLIKDISKGYDYVIIDSSPVGQVSDVLSLNEVADTVLFVLKYDNATIPEIRSALEKLDKSGIQVLGCVVNAAQNVASAAISQEEEKRGSRRRSGKEEKPIWEKSEGEEDVVVDLPEEEPKKGLFRKKKKQKKGRKNRRSEEVQTVVSEDGQTGDVPAEKKPPAAPRNVLADIFEDTAIAPQAEISNEAASEALMRLGVEGSWDEPEQSDAPEEAPAEAEAEDMPAEAEAEEAPAETETEEAPAEAETEEMPAEPRNDGDE